MLIQHSQSILFHRMALSETGNLKASQMLVARYRGEQMIAEAVETLEGGEPAEVSPDDATERAVDRTV